MEEYNNMLRKRFGAYIPVREQNPKMIYRNNNPTNMNKFKEKNEEQDSFNDFKA
jgi:hypothetical protein